jgi:Protein of unknown function (DUF2281)
MSVIETVYEKLKSAPPEVSQQVLDFLEFLESRRSPRADKSSLSWDDMMGALSNAQAFAGIEIQQQLFQASVNEDVPPLEGQNCIGGTCG